MILLTSFRARLAAAISIFLLISAINVQAQRLPTTVVPSHYNLFLDPEIGAQKFTGEETINVHVQQPTNEIVLNSLGLEISLAEALPGFDMAALPAQVAYDQPNEMVRLVFSKPVPKGAIGLHMKFSGKLTSGLRGL